MRNSIPHQSSPGQSAERPPLTVGTPRYVHKGYEELRHLHLHLPIARWHCHMDDDEADDFENSRNQVVQGHPK